MSNLLNASTPIRVLIAEDDALVCEMVRQQLQRLGYVVVGEAYDGHTALTLTQTVQPDILILDIEMPGLDGLSVAEQLHQRCPTPIVILTAYETSELVKKASAFGVGAYLLKPPQPRDLDRAITIALARFADLKTLQQMNAELQRLNAQLQTQNTDLNAYAHFVAHDLKNPLSVVLGYAEFLLEDYAEIPPAKAQEYLNIIVTKSRKTISIVNGLLMLAKVQNLQMELEPVEMGNVVQEVLERLAWSIAEQQAQIQMPSHWPLVLGHPQLIEEVWTNYISNALKYGGIPPKIELGFDPEIRNQQRFWVCDNGPGIAPEFAEKVFEPFIRLPNGKNRADSHGLGLSIVRRIVEKLGGEVGVESRKPHGSCFWFSLPSGKTAP